MPTPEIQPTRTADIQPHGVSMRRWKGVKDGVYHLVQTMDQFWEFFHELKRQPAIAIDTETSGFNWAHDHACGIVVGWGIANNYYLPIAHKTGEKQLNLSEIVGPLSEVFTNPKVTKVFWNEQFDRHFLRKAGLEIAGVRHDGLVLVHLLDENTLKGLKFISKKMISPTADKWEKELKQWRLGESKRRRKEFTTYVKDQLGANREEYEAKLKDSMSLEDYATLKKSQVTAKLKALVIEDCQSHPLAKNKIDDISYDYVPLDVMTPYACADVHYTFLLYKKLLSSVAAHEDLRKLYVNEMQLATELFEAESAGLKVDVPFLNGLEPKLRAEMERLEAEIYEDVGEEFNIGSGPQLVGALKRAGCRLTKLTKKGKEIAKAGGQLEDKHFTADKETLEYLATKYPFAKKILDYRKAQKQLSTYVIQLRGLVDDKHYVHTSFNANVSTGRMSSRSPNFQNQDSKSGIRNAFTVPEEVGREGEPVPDWKYVFIDYGNVELRLTAHHSQDPTFLQAYPCEGVPIDLHSLTAAEAVCRMPYDEVLAIKNDADHPKHKDIIWFRTIAKRINFGIIYGAGASTIQRQISTPEEPVGIEECQKYIDGYFERYPGVKEWIDRTTYALRRHGYLQNSFGRYRRLPDAKSKTSWKRERAGRQGVNFLIQGDAADLFKHAVVRVGKFLRQQNAKTHMVNFVHDEIQFYWHTSELHLLPEVKRMMEDFPQYSVPILAEVAISDRTWGEKREYEVEAA